ncbi:MAG: polymer-forming cytoskeletal protein [Chloroflexi bacterium]|nr:polymer-forming cytoskeletal protein [Chloroflexota bacterium]
MSFFSGRRQAEPAPQPSAPPRPQPLPPTPVPHPVGFETVLGANSTLEGRLVSAANVRLDGTFSGTLEISGNVLVGETGKINADINAQNISIAGAVRGNVSGKKVQLLRTGRIWGDITATALTTEEGAFIDGKITMISPETPTDPDDDLDALDAVELAGDAFADLDADDLPAEPPGRVGDENATVGAEHDDQADDSLTPPNDDTAPRP